MNEIELTTPGVLAELGTAVTIRYGCIVLSFEQPLSWLSLTPGEAEALAEKILSKARAVKGIR